MVEICSKFVSPCPSVSFGVHGVHGRGEEKWCGVWQSKGGAAITAWNSGGEAVPCKREGGPFAFVSE